MSVLASLLWRWRTLWKVVSPIRRKVLFNSIPQNVAMVESGRIENFPQEGELIKRPSLVIILYSFILLNLTYRSVLVWSTFSPHWKLCLAFWAVVKAGKWYLSSQSNYKLDFLVAYCKSSNHPPWWVSQSHFFVPFFYNLKQYATFILSDFIVSSCETTFQIGSLYSCSGAGTWRDRL